MRVFAYGLVALQYTGSIPASCRALVHGRKYPTLEPNDIVLIDETSAVLLVRGGNYKKLDIPDANVANIFASFGTNEITVSDENANEGDTLGTNEITVSDENANEDDTLGTNETTGSVQNFPREGDIPLEVSNITHADIQAMGIEDLYLLCEKHNIKGYKHKKQKDIVAQLLAFYN